VRAILHLRQPTGAFAATALAAVLVAAGVALSAAISSGRPILATRWSLLWLLAIWAGTWLAAVTALFHVPTRAALGIIIAGALLLRLAALAGPPVTSDDLYRYSWDGHVQASGIDPYAQPPNSAALTGLHDPWLWPDPRGCSALHRPAGCTRINRPDVRTIYPPLAEAWFAGAYRLGGAGARYKTWQVAGLGTDIVVVALLIVGLGRWGRDLRWAALYALSPVPVLEVVNNGHVDGLAVALLLAALVVIAPRRTRQWSDVTAGALIGAAALVKLYPALALVAIVGAQRRWVSLLRASAAAALLGALAYLPHVGRVGTRVLGYFPGYLREEHYQGGGRFLIAAGLHVPTQFAGTVSGLAAAAVVAWVVVKRPAVPVAVALVLGTLLLAASPVQPWYAVSLLAAAALAGEARWVPAVLAGYPYFFAIILTSRHATAVGELGYGAALIFVVAASLARRHLTKRATARCVRRNPALDRMSLGETRADELVPVSAP
jgi:hypothetical protein